MGKLLVQNGFVIPVDGRRPYIESGGVAIENDRIVAVGPIGDVRSAFKADQTIDASGKAVLPGFVNTHSHLVGSMNKALTEDYAEPPGGFFRVAIPFLYRHMRPTDVYALSVMHALEMLRTGTTTINEIGLYAAEAAGAVRDTGLRAVIAETIREDDALKAVPGNLERHWDPDGLERRMERALQLITDWHGAADGRITCRFGPNAPDQLSERMLLRIKELAEKRGLGFHMHLAQVPGETEYMRHTYGKTSVQFLHDLGFLSPAVVGAHCVFMTPQDVEIMKATGAHMSHTAYLVGKRGYFPPMNEVYRLGVSVGLGSDWLSNDMFKIMRAAVILGRQQAKSATIVNAARVLEMATMGGARALGLDHEIGSLEPGKKADLSLLNVRTPWMAALRPQQIISNIVYNANGSDITDVIVDGKIVVRDSRPAMVDESAAYAECQRTAEDIWERGRAVLGG